jgi:hypothetical protein
MALIRIAEMARVVSKGWLAAELKYGGQSRMKKAASDERNISERTVSRRVDAK